MINSPFSRRSISLNQAQKLNIRVISAELLPEVYSGGHFKLNFHSLVKPKYLTSVYYTSQSGSKIYMATYDAGLAGLNLDQRRMLDREINGLARVEVGNHEKTDPAINICMTADTILTIVDKLDKLAK